MGAAVASTSLLLVVRLRPFLRGLLAALLPLVAVVVLWTSLAPTNSRDWTPDVAHLPRAIFDGPFVTIQNVRTCKYRSESDYDQRWETRTYNLDQIKGIDLFLSFWGPTEIAHTIVSWEFDGGQHLAISIETRKAQGESYSALCGFFRQYELYYAVADERDLVGLRTNYCGEQVYLYRIHIPIQQARALLIDYLIEVNRLADHPQWYNAFTQNCSTAIRGHAQSIGVDGGFDWRLLANGRVDQLLYERHQIDTVIPFDDRRSRSNITEKAKAAGDAYDFRFAFAKDCQKQVSNCRRDEKRHSQMEPSVD